MPAPIIGMIGYNLFGPATRTAVGWAWAAVATAFAYNQLRSSGTNNQGAGATLTSNPTQAELDAYVQANQLQQYWDDWIAQQMLLPLKNDLVPSANVGLPGVAGNTGANTPPVWMRDP